MDHIKDLRDINFTYKDMLDFGRHCVEAELANPNAIKLILYIFLNRNYNEENARFFKDEKNL